MRIPSLGGHDEIFGAVVVGGCQLTVAEIREGFIRGLCCFEWVVAEVFDCFWVLNG